MQYMLAVFNLRPGTAVDDFDRSLRAFENRMRSFDLVQCVGPLSRRCRDTLLDTDERGQQFGFVTCFRDPGQTRRAIDYLESAHGRRDASHAALHAMIQDAVFSFWEELPPAAAAQ